MKQFGTRKHLRKGLIVQGQRLMVPLLKDVLSRAGLDDVVVYRNASERTMRSARPDVVIFDVDGSGSRPLEMIRNARKNTRARIVVITRIDDSGWNAVARALGADSILGACADRHDLLTAIAAV